MFFVTGMLATAAIVGLAGAGKVGWRVLLAAVGIGALWLIGTSDFPGTRGGDAWWKQPLWRNLFLYIAMFLGMMFRVVQDQIDAWREHNAKPDAGRLRRRPRFDFWEFVYPVIPSLALFQAVLGAAGLAKSLASAADGRAAAVRPEDLESGEKNFYMIGHKSYGRLNSFLLRAGIQQLDMIFSRLA